MKIGELEVLRESRQVTCNGRLVKMSSRAFDLLQLLLDAKGSLVSTEEIMAKVWPSTIVEENNIQVHISMLRRLLAERRDLLQTVTGRGYRMLCASETLRETINKDALLTTLAITNRFSVPAVHGPLFGRDQCVSRVIDALQGEAVVVTLTGPPGVGKSRLSIEVVNRLSSDLRGAVSYLSLSKIGDQAATFDAIGAALEVLKQRSIHSVDGGDAQPRAILIIDDCDRSHDAVIEALNYSREYRQLAKVATILTSRTPLRLSFERIVYVPSLLAVSNENGNKPALDMFIARVRASNPNIDLSPNFETQACHIVEQMDGLPLALEFAAHHASLLGVEVVRHLLDQDVELLSQDLRRMCESRHSSLSSAFMWTWTDLGSLPRAIMASLLHTEHDVDAIGLRELALKDGLPSEGILDAISTLVDSWFVFREYRGSSVIYWIPNTVRRFLRQQTINPDASKAPRTDRNPKQSQFPPLAATTTSERVRWLPS